MGTKLDSNIFRRLALFGGAVALGSVMVDIFRFTPWQDNHSPAVPILVLAGLVLAYSVGWITKYILRRLKWKIRIQNLSKMRHQVFK